MNRIVHYNNDNNTRFVIYGAVASDDAVYIIVFTFYTIRNI